MEKLNLFHTGFEIIKNPDIALGRKNADFGQGFYLSGSKEFSLRWAKQRKGLVTYLNAYELTADGLNIKRLTRNEEWFEYIYDNRSGYPDSKKENDVIIGPIANDTLYDTWGIITSGLLKRDIALSLLLGGPLYEQTVIKTEKALSRLRFTDAREINVEEIEEDRETVKREEKEYQKYVSDTMEMFL